MMVQLIGSVDGAFPMKGRGLASSFFEGGNGTEKDSALVRPVIIYSDTRDKLFIPREGDHRIPNLSGEGLTFNGISSSALAL